MAINTRRLKNIPIVDQGNVYFEDHAEALSYEKKNEKARLQEAKRRQLEAERNRRIMEIRRREEYARDLEAARQAKKLKESLTTAKRDAEFTVARGQKTGFIKTQTVKNHQMPWLPGVLVKNLNGGPDFGDVDFNISEAVPAQDFGNNITAKELLRDRYRDYPLVDDAKGDFGGILTDEAGSPDFSTTIVDDVKSDFGRLPNSERLKRIKKTMKGCC